MPMSERCLMRLRLIRPFLHAPVQRHCRHCFATTSSGAEWQQKTPLGAYYESILKHPLPIKKPHEPPKPEGAGTKSTPSSETSPIDTKSTTPLNTSVSFDTSPPAPPPTSPEEKMRIVFGSQLLGPAEQEDRAAAKRAQSTYIAGILVPPRPEEPDNCCMSGCVNCVWDRYGEDVEEWTAKKLEAEERLKQAVELEASETKRPVDMGTEKMAKDSLKEDAYSSVPVGIREFIKMEKGLRDRHEKEETREG